MSGRVRCWGATGEPVCISRQILREFLAVVTRPQIWARPMPLQAAVAPVQRLADEFEILEDGPAVWDRLKELCGIFSFGGRQVHDANIVVTMLAHGERRLITFNRPDFRRFASVIELLLP